MLNYIGYKPNEFIKENLKKLSYVCLSKRIWEETSCIAAIEAMAAGLILCHN